MPDAQIGATRFMATNLIPDGDAITPSSQAAGLASRPQKSGAGSAVMTVSGSYTHTDNLDFVVRIESTGEIGVSTFRWSLNGGQSWAATGVTTSTSPVVLNHGLSVSWATGSGTDVVIDDEWTFKGFLPYHPMYLLDRDRDTEWRSDSVASAVNLVADFGTAGIPTVLVVKDHNFTSGATILLQGSGVSNFSSIDVNLTVPWQSEHLLYYLPVQSSRRFWRLRITDTANPDGYLRASEWFLGPYTQLTLRYALGDVQGKLRMGKREQMLSGKFFGGLNTVVRTFDLSWIRMSMTDRDSLLAVFDELNDLENLQIRPVFFNPDANDLTDIALCEWVEGQFQASNEPEAPERYTVPVRLDETPRTV